MNGEVERGRDEDAVGEFVERFASTLMEAGWPRMPARVFVALLAAEDGGLGAEGLSEALRVSPAAVSRAVQYLAQVGLVSREREPGERRDRYRVRAGVWYEAFARQDETFLRMERGLAEGIEAVGADTPAGARLDETRRFFEFFRGELPGLMARWREIRSAPEGSR